MKTPRPTKSQLEACAKAEVSALKKRVAELERENSELNKALSLKLDSMPSGLSAGQSVQLENKVKQLEAERDALRALCKEVLEWWSKLSDAGQLAWRCDFRGELLAKLQAAVKKESK